MKRQKKLIQTKIIESTPEKEIDLTNLPEKEFKIKVITMLMELQRKMQELMDNVGRDTTEIKQSLERLKSRLVEVQEAVN